MDTATRHLMSPIPPAELPFDCVTELPRTPDPHLHITLQDAWFAIDCCFRSRADPSFRTVGTRYAQPHPRRRWLWKRAKIPRWCLWTACQAWRVDGPPSVKRDSLEDRQMIGDPHHKQDDLRGILIVNTLLGT